MAHTSTQLRAALAQGATIITTCLAYDKDSEVEWAPQHKGDRNAWRVKGLTGVDRVRPDECEIVWKPGCRKEVHVPTITRLVKKHFEGTGHERADMPFHGGYAVSQTYHNMRSVAFIHWAYAGQEADGTPSNMVERPLTDEVRGMAEMLRALGYNICALREDRNFFHIN